MAYAPVYQMSLISGLLESRLDRSHELLVLANKIDWDGIETSLKPFSSCGAAEPRTSGSWWGCTS